jgi:hypothetical protein
LDGPAPLWLIGDSKERPSMDLRSMSFIGRDLAGFSLQAGRVKRSSQNLSQPTVVGESSSLPAELRSKGFGLSTAPARVLIGIDGRCCCQWQAEDTIETTGRIPGLRELAIQLSRCRGSL